jgi:hypothetical protein
VAELLAVVAVYCDDLFGSTPQLRHFEFQA